MEILKQICSHFGLEAMSNILLAFLIFKGWFYSTVIKRTLLKEISTTFFVFLMYELVPTYPLKKPRQKPL